MSFQQLQHLIAEGKAEKGVPWAFQTARSPRAKQAWSGLLGRLPAIPPHLTLYGAELEQESVIGATPEWLFKIEDQGHTLRTLALAGTRWVGQSRPESLEKKDAREHQLVVEDIQHRLSPYGTVTVGERSWKQAGRVEHLHTPLRLQSSKPLDAVEILRVLHPTPAVGVFPRTPEALDWLHHLPGSEMRADYGAPWLVRHRKDGRAWALVALRQIRLRPEEIFIPAGCGVVKDSVEEVEWNEIQEKIRSVKEIWGLPV